MMGLLDLFNTYEGQQGLGLLAAASARSDGAGFGQRLQEGLGMADNWKRKKAADEFQQMQMADHLARIEEAKAQRAQQVTDSAAVRGAFTPMSGGDAMANGQGPTIANAANIGQVQPFDPRRFLAQNPQASLAALKQAMEMKAAIDPKKKYGFHSVDGNLVRTDEEGSASSVFSAGPKQADPNKPFTLGPNGEFVPNVAYQEYELKKAKSGANNIRLSNVGPKAFETELGKMDAEQLGKWREGAMTAQNTLSTVKKLQEADANGAYSGGAANLKMTVGSYINGITGSTPKGQIGSELYNAEASKLVLDQIKTLGANPSNADRDFIQKTVPQLSTNAEARKAMTQFMMEKAQSSIKLYERANVHARKNSGLGGFQIVEPTGEWSITPVGQ